MGLLDEKYFMYFEEVDFSLRGYNKPIPLLRLAFGRVVCGTES